MNTIQKLRAALAIISIASAASFANAQDPTSAQDSTSTSAAANRASTAANGTSTPDSTYGSGYADSESANSPWGSPPVNRAAPPSDPIPKATTRAEEAKRFAAQEREWQRLSTP